ncbi:MAG: hypothetical protein JRE64_12480 [Deltaproteobacteria bacterium]|nr:hypothetical protein [Deltaproteobacteria bacterium]
MRIGYQGSDDDIDERNIKHLSRQLEQVRTIIGVLYNLGHLGAFPR